MASPKHFNPAAGSPPYRNLFSNVTIAPANCSLAYVSTQWAADPTTGELMEGVADDYAKQSTVVWKNICAILKELGVGMKDIVHVTVSFKLVAVFFQESETIRQILIVYREFNDDIGRAVVEAQMAVIPDEWKPDALKASLSYNGVAHFHRPGMVYAIDLVVAVPAHH